MVDLLLESGCDVNLQSDRYRTALHMAVWNNNSDVVRMLLRTGCDVNIREIYGDTPVMLCARRGYANILKLLLEAGGQVDIRSQEKDTALHYAARHGHADCVQILLNQQPDTEAMTIWGNTPLSFAVFFKHTNAARALIEFGADVFVQDRSNKTLLHYAATNDMLECLELLLNHRLCPDVIDVSGNTPLIDAIRENHVKAATILIRRGCNMNIIGHCTIGAKYAWFTPLEIAVHCGYIRMSRLLVQAGCDVSAVNRWTECGDLPTSLKQHEPWLKWLQEAASGTRHLSELCRLTISRVLGSRLVSKVNLLPVPSSVRDFLAYGNLDLDDDVDLLLLA